MCLPDSLSRVMSLALGYQEGHLLGFIQFFGSRVPPTTSIQKIGFPGQVSRNGGPREDRISRDSQSAFEKRSLKRPSITEAPPCLNFEGSPPVEGGTDVVPRDILSSATLTNALDPRGDSRAGARPPTSSAVFRPIFRIEGAADHLDPEDWIPVTCGSGMPRFSRHTQPRFHDIVNTCPRS